MASNNLAPISYSDKPVQPSYTPSMQISPLALPWVALSPGSLLKNWGRREPGNIRGKSCRLPVPWSAGTNVIVTRKWTYKRRLHLEGWWETGFDVWKGCKSRESKIEVRCSWFAGLTRSPCILHSSCTKCVTELRAADASKTRSEIINSLRCYQV